jgi:hypothetical protein
VTPTKTPCPKVKTTQWNDGGYYPAKTPTLTKGCPATPTPTKTPCPNVEVERYYDSYSNHCPRPTATPCDDDRKGGYYDWLWRFLRWLFGDWDHDDCDE